MDKIFFSAYYLKLRALVALGIYQTRHPLGLKWRWSYWRRKRYNRLSGIF